MAHSALEGKHGVTRSIGVGIEVPIRGTSCEQFKSEQEISSGRNVDQAALKETDHPELPEQLGHAESLRSRAFRQFDSAQLSQIAHSRRALLGVRLNDLAGIVRRRHRDPVTAALNGRIGAAPQLQHCC